MLPEVCLRLLVIQVEPGTRHLTDITAKSQTINPKPAQVHYLFLLLLLLLLVQVYVPEGRIQPTKPLQPFVMDPDKTTSHKLSG